MPIYEYQCQKCGAFETTQKITDDPLERCPTCKGKVKRLISNTSFQLKGTGWYRTDYARKEQPAKEGTAPAAESKGDGKAAAGSDGADKTSSEKEPAKGTTSKSTAA